MRLLENPMKIRIKDPQQGNSKSLFLWAFILAGVVLFLACGVKDEIFLLKLFSVLIPLILLLLVGAFYNLYKARKQRRAPNYVPALDFQPTGVVLSIGGQERVLLYEETPLRLLIHIQQKQHENGNAHE